jgi:signal transduction histidine kinase
LDFAGDRPGRLAACELVQITQDAVREIRSRLEEADIRVETDYRDQPLIVEGDREWLGQAIIEVVTNAIEHSPSGGSIRIGCRRDGVRPEFARIEITDDGAGIPESIRSRVFDLFFTSKPGGHGIGLASVKRVVEMHGGRVAFATHDGRGAHIEITLPLA